MASPASHIPNTLPAMERHFQAIEHRLDMSATRMDSIETLCRQLKSNADIISQQLNQLPISQLQTERPLNAAPQHLRASGYQEDTN